jgi:hypothetical protein
MVRGRRERCDGVPSPVREGEFLGRDARAADLRIREMAADKEAT